MATTPVQIAVGVGIANTTIYDPFVTAGATVGMLVSLHFCNTTAADITIDVFIDMATDVYILKTKTVPALGNLDWTGCIPIDDGTELIKAIASATGVDVTGCVMENA